MENKIKEGNLIIAKFMLNYDEESDMWYNDDKDWSMSDKHLQYHNSWNWIMPVVDKIEKMGYRFKCDSNEESLTYQFIDMSIPGKIITESRSYNYVEKIDVLWESVVKFLRDEYFL